MREGPPITGAFGVLDRYAGCTDVRQVVTPDLVAGDHTLLLVDISGGEARLGGSALAQTFSQLGNICPDVRRCLGTQLRQCLTSVPQ